MNLSRQWLIENGIAPEVIDAALARGEAAERSRAVREDLVLTIPGEPRLVEAKSGMSLPDGNLTWECVIRDWRPASKNQKRGVGIWTRVRRRDNAAIALWLDEPNRPPQATSKRRVTLHATRRRTSGRLPDPQNLIESLADSLVANGLLRDDSGRWATFDEPDLQVDRKLDAAWMTTIRLEDV